MMVPLRVLSRGRRLFPVAVLLPGVVLGQIAALGGYTLLGIVIFGAFMCLPARALFRPCAYGVMLGGVSAYLQLPAPLPDALVGEQALIVEIDDDLRHPRVGEVRLSLRVLGLINDSGAPNPGAAEYLRLSCRAIDLPWRQISLASRGSVVMIRAVLSPLAPELLSYDGMLRRHGYAGQCRVLYASTPIDERRSQFQQQREKIFSLVEQLLGEGERSGLLLSMVFGVRDVLGENTERAFKRTGLAHLLVVSGYQVTLVYYVLRALLWRLLLVSRRFASCGLLPTASSALALLGALGYVALVGVDGPSLRAAIAALAAVIASTLERGGGLIGTTLLAFLFMCVLTPGCFLEAGPQLTFAALLGIALGASSPALSRASRYLVTYTLASVCTAIPLVCWFGDLSLISFVLNPILAPILSVLSCQGTLLALTAYLLGVDSGARLLHGVANLLEVARDHIRVIAEWPGILLHLDGEARFVAVVCLSGVVLSVSWKRLQRSALWLAVAR